MTQPSEPERRGAWHRALVDAVHARRQEQLAAGLLHDLNGPLNNLSLTLALLEAALARVSANPTTDALARCARHLDLLKGESQRLQAWSRTMASLLIEPETGAAAADARTDPGALLPELQRILRHHAALHEVTLGADPAEAFAMAGASWAVRLALLDLCTALIVLGSPGGTLTLAARRGARHGHVALALQPPADAPDDALATLAIVAAADALAAHAAVAARAAAGDARALAAEDLLAGRLRVEALGGSVHVVRKGAQRALEVALPLA